MKKLVLFCTAATIVAPTAAFAQSTGTVDFDKEVIVVTGSRVNNGVGGVVAPDSTKAKAVITQELIARQNPGQTILNTINLVPSVNFTNNDPYGSSGGNLRIRGFDGNRISLTFDGVPLNDSGNYAIFGNQLLDPEVIEEVNVNLGVTDVDSPTASAAGGTVNFRSITPSKTPGVRVSGSIGDFNYRRAFGLLQTGTLTSFGTRAWVSGSYSRNDKFKGPGKIEKSQFNGKIYQPLGANGDFIALAGHYNENRNNFYRNPSITDLRGIFGSTLVPPTASPDAPIQVGDYTSAQQDALFAFENLASCNRTVPLRGVRQDDNGGTGPNGTGATAGAINGSTANNPANSSSCSNLFAVRINPSNTGNIRGSSRFTLADGLILTVDPSYQYVLANGGGSTAFNENDPQLKGSATTSGGVDLNRDGDFLDRIRLLTPNNTNTHRLGLTSSLIWDISHDHRVRVAYTYDRARHRQTGEYGYLLSDGLPFNIFGGRGEGPILDAAGHVLQQRDRTSIALLNQISGQYVGWFLDRKLRVEAGVRRPFFQRNLDQHCYTFASGSGFAYCTSQVLGTTPIAPSVGNYVVPANFAPAIGASVPSNAVYAPFTAKYKFGKLLPNIGATFKFTPEVSIFGSYAKGFSAPRTDNLYRRPVVQVTPEETDAFDLGLRYSSRQIQAQLTLWDINYKNRIVTSFEPDLGISLDRNVGKVASKGVDASIAYKPIKEVSLLAIVSYIDAKLKQNVEIGTAVGAAVQPALPLGTIYCSGAPTAIGQVVSTCAPTAGKRVTETPKLQYGGRIGLELGPVSMGLQGKYVGKRFATDTNDVVSKSYATLDFDARVSLKPLGYEKSYFQLNVINITDRFYYGNISTQINAAGNPNFSLGSPRTFIGTLNIGF